MRALVMVAIYLLPFLAIAVIAKRWMTRKGVELSDVQAEGDPNRNKRPQFLLGIWRDEGRECAGATGCYGHPGRA